MATIADWQKYCQFRPGLQKLKVHSAVCAEEISIIRKYCREVKELFIRLDETVDGEHASLLASYGDQLCKANLNSFSVENVRIVTTSCLNVQVEVRVVDSAVLMVLGKRATDVSFSFSKALP